MTLQELEALWKTPEALWDAWDKALESDRFEKGRGCLRDLKNRYCCLGILNEIAGVQQHLSPYYESEWVQGDSRTVLATNVARFLNIMPNGEFKAMIKFQGAGPHGELRDVSGLISLNDYSKATFPDIARVIREQRAANNFKPFDQSRFAG